MCTRRGYFSSSSEQAEDSLHNTVKSGMFYACNCMGSIKINSKVFDIVEMYKWK